MPFFSNERTLKQNYKNSTNTIVARLLKGLPADIRKWWTQREEELKKRSEKEPLEIKEMLLYFQALDLNNYLKDTSQSVVLFIYTYEALWLSNAIKYHKQLCRIYGKNYKTAKLFILNYSTLEILTLTKYLNIIMAIMYIEIK